jgi:hypothetical protein
MNSEHGLGNITRIINLRPFPVIPSIIRTKILYFAGEIPWKGGLNHSKVTQSSRTSLM